MESKRCTTFVRATATGLLCVASAPAPADYLQGVTGSGLYDFLIKTNCFALPEQQDTRTPYWLIDNTYPGNRIPVFSPGQARGYIRTVDIADQIIFFSSNPAVIPPPPKLQAVGAIGGVRYQQTQVFFDISNLVQRPTDITITAQGTITSVVSAATRLGKPKTSTADLRVYPPQTIKSAALAPARTTAYAEGEQVTLNVGLAWKMPVATTYVEIGMPEYQTAAGGKFVARLEPWHSGTTYGSKRIDIGPNVTSASLSFTVPFPKDAAVQRLSPVTLATSLTIPVRLHSASRTCPELAANPSPHTVVIRVQKMLQMPKPQSSTPLPTQAIQQAPIAPMTSDGSSGGTPAPRPALPTKPDAEPENAPRPPRPR